MISKSSMNVLYEEQIKLNKLHNKVVERCFDFSELLRTMMTFIDKYGDKKLKTLTKQAIKVYKEQSHE